MKIILRNIKNNNTKAFDNITLNDIENFVNKELHLDNDNETGFIYLYKTLGELSFQTEEIQRYIIDGLNYSVSQAIEPSDKDRYNLYLLRLLKDINNIIEWNNYEGEDNDTLFIESMNLECYNHMEYSLNIISFLKALDITIIKGE